MPLRDLQSRCLQPELMDDPSIDPGAHRRALRGLARLNAASRIVPTVERTLKQHAGQRPLRVLDVAAGSGDLVVGLAKRAARANRPWSFSACDISETACEAIRSRASGSGVPIEVFQADALNEALPGTYDIVMCHLFLHHLQANEVITVLARMKAAASGAVFVSDLRRSRRGYFLALAASRVFSRSPVVHTDALRSVEGALRDAELAALADEAGLEGAQITRAWPERMLLWCAR